jgi:hypothetical protein
MDLKYVIRARFELTDSNFYELSQQELHRCLSEMTAPMTKLEFLIMIKCAVHLSLPYGYVPTEHNVGTFLNQLFVYKEKLIHQVPTPPASETYLRRGPFRIHPTHDEFRLCSLVVVRGR